MKAAIYRGIGEIEVTEVPEPHPDSGEVVVRVGYCGICGSDVEGVYVGMYPPDLIVGHEFAGTIAEIGPDVTGWKIGDRVIAKSTVSCGACASCQEGHPDTCESQTIIGVTHDGAMAEYARAAARSLLRLPDSVTLRQGALVEPLTVALRGVRRSRLQLGDRVLIIGAGPIGLLTLQCARLAGARTMAVTEVNPTRAELAGHLGATAVLDPTRDNVSVALSGLTRGKGADVVFICTGAPGPFQDAISLVRPGGQILVIGVCMEPVGFEFLSVVMNELCIESSFGGRTEWPAALELVSQGRVDVDSLVSHEISLDEIVTKGFERLHAPGSGAIKILVRIGGE